MLLIIGIGLAIIGGLDLLNVIAASTTWLAVVLLAVGIYLILVDRAVVPGTWRRTQA